LGYSQKKPRAMSCVDHLAAFVGIHAHGLFAEHRLAAPESREHIETMTSVGRGNEHGIDFRREAELVGGGKVMRDVVFLRGSLGLLRIAALERSDGALGRELKARHQSPDSM
jgi:hypothetical protein